MNELCNKDLTSGDEKWIIFDGPIDTKWIESMNSLLDDNKVLTLLDGNRINLKPNVKIIFEVDELD
jgi:dynein heavy chain